MAVEKKRLLFEFYVLSTKKLPTKSTDLANEIGVSVRTFKSDIEDLKQFAIASGARLESKNGLGYWLEIDNEDVYNPVKEQLDISFNSIDYTKEKSVSRKNDILRMIIASDEYTKVEDIASSLYLSVSAIRKDLKESRKILDSYHLTLDSKKEKGIKVIGDEFGIRMCMVELLEKHYARAMYLYKDLEFSSSFEIDEEVKKEVRKTILNVVRYEDIALLDKYINRLCKYYALALNRIKKKKILAFNQKDIEKLHAYPYRNIAERIICDLNQIDGVFLSEEEINSTQLLLLIWSDYNQSIDFKAVFHCIYPIIVETRNYIFDILQNYFHLDLSDRKDANKVIESGVVSLCIKKDFDVSSYTYVEKAMSGTSLLYSGIVSVMAKTIIHELSTYYHTSFSNADINTIAVRLYFLIDSIQFDYRPVSLAICSRNGIVGAEIIKNKILNRYNKEWFKKLDVHEFYCLRKYDKYDYDYILFNFPVYSYHYDIPFMSVSQIITNEQIADLYNNILIKNYQITDILNDFEFNQNSFYENYEFDNYSSFISMIAYKNGKDANSIQELIALLSENYSHQIADNTCFMMCDSKYTKGNCFEVYTLKRRGIIEDREIDTIIFLSMDLDFNLQKLKYIESVIYCLMRFVEKRNELLEEKDIQYLNSIVYECLING